MATENPQLRPKAALITDANGTTSADVAANGGLNVNVLTGGGGGGTANQGTPNTPANAWPVKITDAAGVNEAAVDASGNVAVSVSNFPATQPVSAASLPLPTNASKETGGNLASIATHQTDGTQTTQVTNFPATQAVSAAALPLPANAAKETGGNLASIASHQTDGTQQTQVTNFPATQPVSGTVTVQQPSGASLHVDVDNFPATQATNLTQVGGATLAPATNDAPVGTEIAPIVRDIFRKRQTLLTSTPLAANGVFTSAWFDSELTGTAFVMVTGISNVASLATTGCQLQESEDQTNVRVIGNTGAAATNRIQGYVRARYWRVVYTNGGTIQATFTLYATETSLPFVGFGIPLAQSIEPLGVLASSNVPQIFGDNQANQNGAFFIAQNGSGFMQANVCYLYNGSTWDRPRTPNIFKQATATASGSTALWTPTAGKKFRLMRFRVQVTGLAKAASSADLVITLLDSASDIGVGQVVTIPTTAGTTGNILDSAWIDLGNGRLSALANNVLNINLSFALIGGLVNVTCCGTEE
jgi:hypothetical protein